MFFGDFKFNMPFYLDLQNILLRLRGIREASDWQIWDNSKEVFLASEVVEELRIYQRA